MLESAYRSKLIKKLRKLYPDCYILLLDPNYLQGIPDLLILFNDRWAALETKKERNSAKQANQEWHVERLNQMSFSAFIYPENEREVLRELQRALQPQRPARIS